MPGRVPGCLPGSRGLVSAGPPLPESKHLVRGLALANRALPSQTRPNRPVPGQAPVPAGLRATLVITLAMMSVFTLAAGVAVATLMPARLALWNIPRVAARPPAAASPGAAGRPLLRPAAHRPRPVRGTVPDTRLPGARQAGRRRGRRPRDRPGAVRPGGLDPDPAGLHDQAGDRDCRAGRARPRGPVHHPGGLGYVARIDRAGRRRGSDPGRRAGPRVGLPAASHAQGAGRRHRASAARPGAPLGPDELRRLPVHRAAAGAGVADGLHHHRQRHRDHLARGGPGPADPGWRAAGRGRPG